MFDRKLYHEVCEQLHTSQETIEEMIHVAQGPKKRVRRPVQILVAAAALTTMVVGVGAANPEAVQSIFYNITATIKVGDYRQEMTTSTGEQITVFDVPQVNVENRDGRAILVVDGEETDITDALEETGRYTRNWGDEGTELTLEVIGSVEEWEATVWTGAPGEEPSSYTVRSNEDSLRPGHLFDIGEQGSITSGEVDLNDSATDSSEDGLEEYQMSVVPMP